MNQAPETSFVAALLTWARRHTAVVLALSIAVSAIGAWLISQTTFDANVLRLLPRHSAAVGDFQSFLLNFGSLDHLYITFDAEDGIGDRADFVDAYVAGLRRAPEIESVDAQLFEPGKDWNYLADRELYLLGSKGAADALKTFEEPRLGRELAHSRELLAMPSPQVKALVQQDPLGFLNALRRSMQSQSGLGASDTTQEGYISPDGRSRLVMVKPKGAPFDTDFCKALFARLSTIEADARRETETAAPVRVQAAGAYRVSIEAESLIRRETMTNSIASVVILVIVMIGVFRTPWILVGGFAPLVVAAILTLGVTGRLRGALSPATSGSAGMLFGLGIDAVVLLYLRYLEECDSGVPAEDAFTRMAGTASSVVLAQATTAATFLALLIMDFPMLQDLGTLVGIGIIVCCAFTLLILPGLLPERGQSPRALAAAARRIGRFVTRRSTAIVVAAAVATVTLGVASRRIAVDTSIDRLQAQTSGSRLEEEIAARFGLPRDVLIVLHEDSSLEPLLQTDERLRAALAARLPHVTVNGVGLFLPSAQAQQRVAAEIRGSQLTPSDAATRIAEASARLGFRADAFAPFIARLQHLLDPGEGITYDGLLSHGLDTLVSRFVARDGNRFQIVTYVYAGPADIAPIRTILPTVDPGLRLTGLPVINEELRDGFLGAFAKALAVGMAAVALLVYVVFRTFRYTLLSLAPTIVGFIWSAGLLAIFRVELDLFSMFATVTFIGIAVDYGIYILYRYVFERPAQIDEIVAKTGTAIIIAGVAAVVGFGSSINSSYRPLHVFGIVSLVTLSCCLAASLLVLPALLVLLEQWSPSSR